MDRKIDALPLTWAPDAPQTWGIRKGGGCSGENGGLRGGYSVGERGRETRAQG